MLVVLSPPLTLTSCKSSNSIKLTNTGNNYAYNNTSTTISGTYALKGVTLDAGVVPTLVTSEEDAAAFDGVTSFNDGNWSVNFLPTEQRQYSFQFQIGTVKSNKITINSVVPTLNITRTDTSIPAFGNECILSGTYSGQYLNDSNVWTIDNDSDAGFEELVNHPETKTWEVKFEPKLQTDPVTTNFNLLVDFDGFKSNTLTIPYNTVDNFAITSTNVALNGDGVLTVTGTISVPVGFNKTTIALTSESSTLGFYNLSTVITQGDTSGTFSVQFNNTVTSNELDLQFDISTSEGALSTHTIVSNPITLEFGNATGTNWSGYASGSLRVHRAGHNATISKNEIATQYSANNLLIPTVVVVEGTLCNITTIDNNAFDNVNGGDLTGTLTLPNTLTMIGASAFDDRTHLNGILSIPYGVTAISLSAFDGCSGFTGALTIPNSVATIGASAFAGCSGITSLTLPANGTFTTISQNTFKNCSAISGNVIIPTTVTSIQAGAFSGCTNLFGGALGGGQLRILDNITSIGEGAFSNCTSITSIEITSINTATIQDNAFSGCSSVDDIYMSNFESSDLSNFANNSFSSIGAVVQGVYGGIFHGNAQVREDLIQNNGLGALWILSE